MAAPTDSRELAVSPAWLAGHLRDADVKILDVSWYLPAQGRDAAREFEQARIPGAQRFDIDAVAELASPFPHMLPSAAAFGAAADALGVGADDTVIVYDGLGTFSAPRAWWTWRVFGHERVALLDGGLPAWRAGGHPVDSEPPSEAATHAAAQAAADASADGGANISRYPARLDAACVKSMADVDAALTSGDAQLVDARPAPRFRGLAAEPRPEVPRGHMPGAVNLPFLSLLEGEQPSGTFRDTAALRSAFEGAGVDLARPIVCTCGSGATACHLAHALARLGLPLAAVYDGSWMEWATAGGGHTIESEAPPA